MALQRIKDIVMATIHEGLDKIEDPMVMLNQYLREMESECAKAKHAVIKQQILERSFAAQMDEMQKMAGKRKGQAQLALDAGEEDLARKAVAEMKHYEAKAAQYREFHEKAAEQVRELKEQVSMLEEKIQTLKDKKYALLARANAARAKEHIYASINRIDSESSFREFQRLEERIMEMEIKANAYTGYDFLTNDMQLRHHLYNDEVEKELENMRAAKKKGKREPQTSPESKED